MQNKQYKDWIDLDIVEDYDKFISYLIPRLETTANKYHWFKSDFKNLMVHEIPKAIYLAIKIKQIGKINELDALLAHTRFLMRFSRKQDLRMFTNHQHEVAETLLNVVGGKIGAMKKNIQSNRV